MNQKVNDTVTEPKVIIPEIYTDIVTVGRVYSVLKEVAIEWLMTGKVAEELGLDTLGKQAKGEASFSQEFLLEKLNTFYGYIFKVMDKLLLDGKEAKIVEVYEIVTKTKIINLDEMDIEIILGAIANFSLRTARKVGKYIYPIMSLTRVMKLK